MDYFKATQAHIDQVERNIFSITSELSLRGNEHDDSKLHDPEATAFSAMTPLLAGTTYGSDAYHGFLTQLGPALEHHYRHNSHHPEHYPAGVAGMTLVDLVEMFCDWLAATKRHDDGDIFMSIAKNQARFGISDQLTQIFRNTARVVFGEKEAP